MLESFRSSNFEYKKLTEEEQQKRGILARIVGPIADYKNPTRNGRKYTEKLWEHVFDDPIVKEKIDNKCLYGELGHPEDRLETDMSKICICLSEQPKKSDDGKLYGVFDVLDTPNGRILKTLLDYGTSIGVSSRGEGDLISDYSGEDIVDPETYQFECWDAVILPAVKAARVNRVNESLEQKKTLKQALLEDLNRSSDNDKLVMNETLESLGINLDEGIQYKGYDITITQSGVQLRKSDGSFIREFPTEQEAKEYVDEMNESLKEDSNESSIKDVDIQKEGEKKEADNDGDNLVAELQEALLRNADLEKIVKGLQERLSVSYAKEKRYEGQLNAYKSSIQSLQEQSKKATSLEGRISSLQEELTKSKLESDSRLKTIDSLKGKLNESLKKLEESSLDHTEKQNSAKEIVQTLTDKVQSLQEELESVKSSKSTSIKILKETYNKRESILNDQLSNAQKDSKLKLQQLQEKLDRANEIATKYQDIAKKAVNKYIVEKTNALNISADDVRNRLGKSYSFNDIDRICESLSASKLAINKLPFKVSQVNEVKVNMNESVKPSISSFADGDYIDPQLMSMVDRLY